MVEEGEDERFEDEDEKMPPSSERLPLEDETDDALEDERGPPERGRGSKGAARPAGLGENTS
jgi:hypothetical protein